MGDALSDIRRLLPMLDMAYQAEQLKMSKIITRIRDLRSQLIALERPQKTACDHFSAATLAGADLRWDVWAHERKALINRELALASRDRERAKTDMVKALSKLEAAKQMRAHAALQVRRTTERRANW